MTTKVSYLKGVRTRYRNTLEIEVEKSRSILQDVTEPLESEHTVRRITLCVEKLKVYCEKLEKQSEKIVDGLEDPDEGYIDGLLEEDTNLVDIATECYLALQQMKENIIKKVAKEETREEMGTEQIFRAQKEMQMALLEQIGMQQQFIERQERKQAESEKVAASSVLLPKIDIVPFDGDRMCWIEFWDSFECAIHKNKRLSNIEKFTYLKSKLHGEAARTISGIASSNESYILAIQLLKERFGNRQEVIDLHYNALINMHHSGNTTNGLRCFLDNMNKHLRCLEVLKQGIDQAVFVSIIKSKLPRDVLLPLEMQLGSSSNWTTQKLTHYLSDYVSARERSEGSNFGKSAQRPNEQKRQQKTSFKCNSKNGNYRQPNVTSGEALIANDNDKIDYYNRCRYCEKKHWSDECPTYRTVSERKRQIKGSCYRCLKVGHVIKDCKRTKRCVHCGETNTHHRSLCPKKFKITDSLTQSTEETYLTSDQNASIEENVLMSSNEMVLMQTATTDVKSPNSPAVQSVRVLLDSGSQRTYITSQLAKELGLKGEYEQSIKLVTFGSEKPTIIKSKVTSLCLKLSNGRFMKISANIVPVISGNVSRKPMQIPANSQLDHLLNGFKLADSIPRVNESSTIELLIGNDYYLDLILPQKIEALPGLYLLSSKLGWILTGRTEIVESDPHCTSMLIMTHGTNITQTSVFMDVDQVIDRKPDIEDFWNIESIGIKDNTGESGNEKAIESFRNTLKFVDNRYQVTWPWIEDEPDLPKNRGLAIGRLRSIVSKLKNKPDLLHKYASVIQDQINKGVVERVDTNRKDGPIHYLPHHAVVNPLKPTTKLRIVYDASAKSNIKQNSLNDCLYRGPVMLNDLCGMLMRFRLHQIALMADIEKAFLQVGLQPSQRDVTRFVWLKNPENPSLDDGNIQEFRFCRVPFGIISSPFLLGAVINSHLESYNNAFCNTLKEDIYVDNLMTGTNSVRDAVQLYTNSKRIFNDASMNLRDWVSNSEHVNTAISVQDRAVEKVNKVLGLLWDIESDTLSIKPVNDQCSNSMTKRSILKVVASVFDPLGLFTPIVLRGKLLLQRIWGKCIDWDNLVDDEDAASWLPIEADLKIISDQSIQRKVGLFQSEGTGETVSHYQLHCFCDASAAAYAATVYLLQQNNHGVKSDLVFSKSRLAPIKSLTIPRLELMAVVIGVKGVKFVQSQLQLDIDKVCVWTDAKCVINWILSSKKLPVFVNNRVSEIRKHSEISVNYVSTTDNPADIATRGNTVRQHMQDNLWWHGPQWLCQKEYLWPNSEKDCSDSDDDQCTFTGEISDNKCKQEMNMVQITACKNEPVQQYCPFEINYKYFSSLTNLLKVTSLAYRFIQRLKKIKPSTKNINSLEMENAEKSWIRYVQLKNFPEVFSDISKNKINNLQKQLGLFIDSSGILRCKGRLEHSSLSESAKHPILLPRNDVFTRLVIEKTHKQILHSGVSQTLSCVRMRYWIPQGRATVKSALRQCLICRRYEGGPYTLPPFPPLPRSRVTEATPFTRTGLDYLGPLYIRKNNETKKVWVCLFTCLVTRAIHLELVQDMTAVEFLLGFKRFISQRGSPLEIISDNAPQFKKAGSILSSMWKNVKYSSDVQHYMSSSGIKWTFIVEMAPWMGGFYERLVGLVKRSLRKSLGRNLLTLIQLQTLIKEIEAVINSRPLVYVGEDLNSNITLTPAHFLTLNPKIGTVDIPQGSDFDLFESSAVKLKYMWKKGQKLLNSFWKIWREEYLASLRERSQMVMKSGRVFSVQKPKTGDVVLIKEDLPRGRWKISRIVELVPSSDGQIRSARVRLASGRVLRRPFNLLVPIETSENSNLQQNNATGQIKNQNLREKTTRKAAKDANIRIKHILQTEQQEC